MSRLTDTFRNIFKIHELRQRIFYTLALLFLVRLGAHITIPGVDTTLLTESMKNATSDNLFGLYDLFVGVLSQMLRSLHLNKCLIYLHLLSFSFLVLFGHICKSFSRKVRKAERRLRNGPDMAQLLFLRCKLGVLQSDF